MSFKVRGIPQALADEVRRTRLSPGYGHPVHEEIASGTGPCRCCLRPFDPGRERRLLFTYRPAGDDSSLMAPGPVFIHAGHCDAYSGEGFPAALRSVAIAFEARAAGSRVSQLTTDPGVAAETQIERLFGHSDNDWLHVRHAQAGCFIARVDRSQ
jgi:hypothetical protein